MNIKKLKIFLVVLLIFCFFSPVYAWVIAPVRFETDVEPGREYTLSFKVINDSQTQTKRFEAKPADWDVDEHDTIGFDYPENKVEYKYSATSWIKITPTQFTVPPGGKKTVRFSFTVPENLSENGDYATAIIVGERNIEKPIGKDVVAAITQQTNVGVIVYLTVGPKQFKMDLKDLSVIAKPSKQGFCEVKAISLFDNQGNTHIRGNLDVKLTRTDDASKTRSDANSKNKEIVFDPREVVVVRNMILYNEIDMPYELPENSSWDLSLIGNFGRKIPELIGKKSFTVSCPVIKSAPSANKKK